MYKDIAKVGQTKFIDTLFIRICVDCVTKIDLHY